MEELEQALREFGMNDGKDIKEIISEVDSDNVSQKEHLNMHTLYAYNDLQFCNFFKNKFINKNFIFFLQDGRINYDEFVAMMKKGNPETAPNAKKRRDVFVE